MGRVEERVRCMERVPWKLNVTICKIDSQWEFAVCLRKFEQGLCNNLEGWGGEGDGREVQEGGDIYTPMAFCLVKAVVFPVFTYGCESWTVKKAEP